MPVGVGNVTKRDICHRCVTVAQPPKTVTQRRERPVAGGSPLIREYYELDNAVI
jgi:L-aminopeptidase/D-esterase-like protein